MNVYIYSQKIVDKDILDFLIIADPISLLGKLRKFLLFSNGVGCADYKGSINFKTNKASSHFLAFGKEKKIFFEQIIWFCKTENIFLLNITDKSELREKEKVFASGCKKTREYIESLKDEYDMHKVNKYIFGMASCIKNAEEIISGKIKVY